MAVFSSAPYNRLKFLDTKEPLVLHYYEIWEDENTVHTRNGAIRLEDVQNWLSLANEYAIKAKDCTTIPDEKIGLRLISFDRRNLFTIACGDDVFDRIRSAFKLHDTSSQAITNNNGSFARYFTEDPSAHDISKLDIIFKMPNCFNVGYDALSISHDLKNNRTRALLHGVSDRNFQWLLEYFRRANQTSLCSNPLTIAAGVLWNHRIRTETYRARLDDLVHKREIEMGHAIPGVPPDSHLRSAYEKLKTLSPDFESTVKDLHSCLTELVGLRYVGDFGKDLGQFLCTVGKELQELRSGTNTPRFNTDPIVHQIEFSTNLYMTLTSQLTTLKERVQNHIDLSYSLIAQDENRVSRSVAMETAIIAVATKRDSAAMKTIAVLTIVFLPPTYVATLLGMPMLNWNSQSGTNVVSRYFWVYWAVAIPLTTLVLIVWRIWWEREDKKYRHDLREAKQDKSQASSTVLPKLGRQGDPNRTASSGS